MRSTQRTVDMIGESGVVLDDVDLLVLEWLERAGMLPASTAEQAA